MHDKRLLRVDATQLRLSAATPFPVRIFANNQVAIEPAAVDELLSVVTSQDTLDRLRGDADWNIEGIVLTPDFHKGAGIPIGTVLKTKGVVFPQAIGNDINCGMRLHTTNLDAENLVRRLDALDRCARHLFFEGGRQIPMTSQEREALLTGGLAGLFETSPWDRLGGQWETVARLGWHGQLDHVEGSGTRPA